MKNFFHGIARMFTISRANRKKIDEIAPDLKAELTGKATALFGGLVDSQVSDPAENAALKAALAQALVHAGITKN